jgi:hypothetical protein
LGVGHEATRHAHWLNGNTPLDEVDTARGSRTTKRAVA